MKARLPIAAAAAVAVVALSLALSRRRPASSSSVAPPPAEASVAAPPPATPPSLPSDFLPSFFASIRNLDIPAGSPEATKISSRLEAFAPSQLSQVAAALCAAPDLDSELRTFNLGQIAKLLERRDPAAALALFDGFAPSLEKKDRCVVAADILPAAALDEPERTAAWWSLHAPDFEDSAGWLQAQILGWAAKRQPAQAFAFIDRFHITDLYSAGNSIGCSAAWSSTLPALRDYLRRHVADPSAAETLRRGLMSGISGGLLYLPRAQAFSWAETLDPAEQRSLAEGFEPFTPPLPLDFVTPLDAQGPPDWLAWIAGRIAPEHFCSKVESLFTFWTLHYPDGAEGWIASATDPAVKEAAARGYIQQIAPAHPEDASRVALMLPEGPSRRGLLRRIEDARSLRHGFLEERPGE